MNSLALVPSIVHQLATSPKTKKADVSSVSLAGSGGAFLPAEIAKKMTEVFSSLPAVAQGYGLSEAVRLFKTLERSSSGFNILFRPSQALAAHLPECLEFSPMKGTPGY